VRSFGDCLDDYEESKKRFVIGKNLLRNMKRNSIVMHPLPRVGEINQEVDRDLRAVYYKQIHYGICIRMTILCSVLGKVPLF
jgi:aspartate carbamoyltransferase catalytic subunit